MNRFAQRLTVDKLHRNEMHSTALTDFINVRDVRMIECRRGLRFLDKPTHPILISGNIGSQHL